MTFKFGIRRLLVAVLGVAVPLALFRSSGAAGVAIASIVGLALPLIALTINKNQIWSVIRSTICAFLGTVIGLMLCPMTDPPHEPGDEVQFMIVGCLLGCTAGAIWNSTRHTTATTVRSIGISDNSTDNGK